jgi:hypothetical protein
VGRECGTNGAKAEAYSTVAADQRGKDHQVDQDLDVRITLRRVFFIQKIRPGPRLIDPFRNEFVSYSEGLIAPGPTPKAENHPLSFVRGCVFNIFAANLQLEVTVHVFGNDSHKSKFDSGRNQEEIEFW